MALLIAGHYYMENAVVSKLDSHGVARLGSLSMFFGALLLTFLWVAPIDHGLVHHLSAGVGMATILFTVGEEQLHSDLTQLRQSHSDLTQLRQLHSDLIQLSMYVVYLSFFF